jgi:hypothetical protein
MKDYQGIKWVEQHKRWQSSVRYGGIHYACGMHLNQKDAVIARDTKIIEKNLPAKLQMLKKVKV